MNRKITLRLTDDEQDQLQEGLAKLNKITVNRVSLDRLFQIVMTLGFARQLTELPRSTSGKTAKLLFNAHPDFDDRLAQLQNRAGTIAAWLRGWFQLGYPWSNDVEDVKIKRGCSGGNHSRTRHADHRMHKNSKDILLKINKSKKMHWLETKFPEIQTEHDFTKEQNYHVHKHYLLEPVADVIEAAKGIITVGVSSQARQLTDMLQVRGSECPDCNRQNSIHVKHNPRTDSLFVQCSNCDHRADLPLMTLEAQDLVDLLPSEIADDLKRIF
ncbi:hypothetical protein ACQ4M3_39490 [Leptolyngbya sp. AN03gr2]|uniref:hypothetical protein n=1 Tax=unclassified Leptolyngbya TaxID=2650499 RepID=UPI003D3100EE